MDVLSFIYEALTSDPFILERASGQIKYYEYPETGTVGEGAHIIIDPLDVPTPWDFADNEYLKYDVLIQIDTWSKKRSVTKEIADRIEFVLWEKGLRQVGGLDEYDSQIFRDARRYRGRFYRGEII